MKRGDRFIMSKQIGNILLHRPLNNIAEIKGFANGQAIVLIDGRQYLLPIDKFMEFIIEKVEGPALKNVQKARTRSERAPLLIESEPTPEPKPDPEPASEPTPEPPDDLYDDDYI